MTQLKIHILCKLLYDTTIIPYKSLYNKNDNIIKIYNKMEQLYLKKCNCGNFELEHYFNTKTNEMIYINKNSDKLEKLCKSNRCNYFFNNNFNNN